VGSRRVCGQPEKGGGLTEIDEPLPVVDVAKEHGCTENKNGHQDDEKSFLIWVHAARGIFLSKDRCVEEAVLWCI